MDKNQFIFAINDDVQIDIATISDKDFKRIKDDVRFLINSKQCSDIGKAYICAFLLYIQDVTAMATPFNPEKDLFM